MGDSLLLWTSVGLLGAGLAVAAGFAWRLAQDKKSLQSELVAAQAAVAERERILVVAQAEWATAPMAHVAWAKGGRAAVDPLARQWLNLPAEGDCTRADLVAGLKSSDQADLLNAITSLEKDGRGFSFTPAPGPGMRLRWNGIRSG